MIMEGAFLAVMLLAAAARGLATVTGLREYMVMEM